MSDTVNTTSLQENEATEAEVIDKLAYTKKRYLRPKEIAAFVLVNFGQKNLSQFVGGEKQFFLVQYAGLDPKHFANIELFATIYDAIDDTLSGLIIDRTRTRWGRVRPFFILPLPLCLRWLLGFHDTRVPYNALPTKRARGVPQSEPAELWGSSPLRRMRRVNLNKSMQSASPS